MKLGLLVALSLIAAPAALAKDKTDAPVDPGPAPDFATAQATSEAAIRSSMFDPGSAQFQWPFAWAGGYWKPVLQGRKIGWWTCGLVNAKNRMGGYVGFQNFAVVFANGALIHQEVGNGQQFDFTNMACAKALKEGTLKRVETVAAAPVALDPAKPGLGVLVGPAPDGLYVAKVLPGYPAAAAGIEPGMVIAAINGIELKGLPAATATQILGATSETVALRIIGKGVVSLTKALPTGIKQ